ncbi:sugar phosphate isomerase/epimerase family protein [Actinacidiphila sp. ITFR-21]|uniref:sugar phosphate isomerase/epimerase family protein n=1 Tax=Actinacidiphila sp. ITFR-21 TaxID=3075199 RepID=UPI00288BC5AC|nr:sugar phosphate isomerase/epimerase family protein [Streptomyces sp. ITFR-21]WNI15617.1 sugar phosphate isomerase/epimerase family protein [Streptomyces sp. ITFR-21]
MRFAFSTLGVPTLPVDEVVRLASEYGYHGVELRASDEGPVHTGLTAGERSRVARQFAKAGVEILTVAAYAKVAAPGDDDPVLDEIGAAMKLAADLGAPFVRVFPGGGDLTAAEADGVAARRLAAAAPVAGDLGVRVLLETHDSHRGGADVARVLGLVGHHAAGAIWDVMHTWLAEEQPSATYPVLAPYLGYVQVKDIASATDTTPLPLGAGVLPLAETIEVLSRAEWEGWLCWEYEKRWYDEAAELPGLLEAGREHLARLLVESA